MGNNHEAGQHDEAPLTPRCGYCGTPLVGKPDRAKYCDRRCKELARERRKRDRVRVTALRQKYPHADMSLLTFHDDQDQDDGYPDGDDQGPGEDDALPTDPRYTWESIASRYEGRASLAGQAGREALQALGNALPGHRYKPSPYRGRATHDIWRW